jgi:hypothetical protein
VAGVLEDAKRVGVSRGGAAGAGHDLPPQPGLCARRGRPGSWSAT